MTNAPSADSNYLKQVREQYENYPYPPRDPEREKFEFTHSHTCALDCINHYHYNGKRDFAKGFRALVAGGGTGDGVIMLADQLRDTDAEVVYLDISQASMNVAKNRAKVRKLDNITWIHGSILDAPRLLDGKFDFIDCIGVLHHLESPEAGLAALASVLKVDGVMGLMLYARYGRESVYQIQSLMRLLNRGEENMQRKVENCKSILDGLPATNGFKQVEYLMADTQVYGDVGVYDLFLHSNDVAYSVPEVYAFLASAKLELTHFFFDHNVEGNNLYRPEHYIKDPRLAETAKNLSPQEQYAAAELLHGKIVKHIFYAAKTKSVEASLDDINNVPYFSMLMNNGAYAELCAVIKPIPVGNRIEMKMPYANRNITFTKSPNMERFFQVMDDHKSIGQVIEEVRASYGPSEQKPSIEALKQELAAIFEAFHMKDWMYLRDKSLPKPKTALEIARNVAAMHKAQPVPVLETL